MADPNSLAPDSTTESTSYAPYAQLAKMLVPSSGCIAIHDVDGDLIWCSDGIERPDLRELVEELQAEGAPATPHRGKVRQTTNGVTAFGSVLRAEDGRTLGYVLIELGAGNQGAGGSSMAASLLRPVLECLAARIHLEREAKAPRLAPADEPAADASEIDELELLLGLSDSSPDGRDTLARLVGQCVENLACVCGAFVLPDLGVNVVVRNEPHGDQGANRFLDRTQKHLLAWARRNNRPMVVNRVGNDPNMAPYKILSCPVRDANQKVMGLMALFRAADAPNFEIRDVRILEFVSRRAVGILGNEHDALTGLLNRLAFERRVQVALQPGGGRGTLLYLDIDRLQYVNDAFGFAAGDDVIKRLGELLRGSLDAEDFASRIVGDRFAAFLPNADEAEATSRGRRMLDAMGKLGYLQGSEHVPVSISVGVAEVGRGLDDVRHLLAAAELACKQAKRRGRNQLEVYASTDDLPPTKQQELFAAAQLQQAIQNSEFRLLAQPIVALRDGEHTVRGLEILVRMRDSSGELVSPDKFMLAAERYGLMPAVDKWVFATIVEDLKSKHTELGELPLGISINVSGQTVASNGYAEHVLELLGKHRLPADLFCFEVKESAAVNHLGDTEKFIGRMSGAGCRVALDDFGSGLTSLTHLKRLRVDYVKIDGALVRHAPDDRYVESLILGLTKAAQTLGVPTVAEHVESHTVAQKLAQMGVDYAQGYCFGHPMPLARALAENVRPLPLLKAGQS